MDAAASAIAQTASRIAGVRRDQSTSSAPSWGQFGGEFTTGDTTATDKTSILSGIPSVVRVQYGPLRETPACRHVGVFRWCVAALGSGAMVRDEGAGAGVAEGVVVLERDAEVGCDDVEFVRAELWEGLACHADGALEVEG